LLMPDALELVASVTVIPVKVPVSHRNPVVITWGGQHVLTLTAPTIWPPSFMPLGAVMSGRRKRGKRHCCEVAGKSRRVAAGVLVSKRKPRVGTKKLLQALSA